MEASDLGGVIDSATAEVDLVQKPLFLVELVVGDRKRGRGRKRDAEGYLFERHHSRRHRMRGAAAAANEQPTVVVPWQWECVA